MMRHYITEVGMGILEALKLRRFRLMEDITRSRSHYPPWEFSISSTTVSDVLTRRRVRECLFLLYAQTSDKEPISLLANRKGVIMRKSKIIKGRLLEIHIVL